MDAVSGGIASPPSDGSGGESLFAYDPLQAMSKRRRNKKLEGMKCWPQVKNMISNGTPVSEIVHYIQNTRKEYVDVKNASLITIINQWIAYGGKTLDTRIPTKHINLINSNKERIEPIDAMNMLFAIQMDRVLIGYEKEKKTQTLTKDNNGAMSLAIEMLNSIDSMQKIDPRIPKAGSGLEKTDSTLAQMDRIKKLFEDRWGGTAAKVLMDPESRNRLFNAVHKIRKTSSVTMSSILQKNSEQAESIDTQVIEVSSDDIIDTDFSEGN